jgi:hypothetical protein
MLVRLLHKVVDTQLREFIFGDMQAPSRERLERCKIFLGQGGFQKRRSAYDQAMILYAIVAAQQSKQGGSHCLYAAFLDIYKAFDRLDHGHLLDMLEHNIGLPPDWLEVLRRLMVGNCTTVMGRPILLTIGAFQGSSLSPLLCLVFVDDLARDLTEFFRNERVPFPFQVRGLPGRDRHFLLLLLLLFADDILALGLTPMQLQRLVTRIGEWATRRGLVLSSKDFAAVLVGKSGVPRPMEPLTVHGHTLEWCPDKDIFDYLGIPFRAYHRHRRLDACFPLDMDALDEPIRRIRSLCHASDGVRVIFVPALVTAIKQRIFGKALYPTAVIDLDYQALDSVVYELLRTLLQLPKCTPKALLFWELRILPSELQAYRRALRQMGRFVHHCFFYPYLVEPLLQHGDAGGLSQLFSYGPFRRFIRILEFNISRQQTIGDIVLKGFTDHPQALRKLAGLNIDEWNGRVETAIGECFTAWMEEKLSGYPPCYRGPLRAGLGARGRKAPAYLSLGGDRARTALRFKVPFLRYYHDRTQGLPQCAWCGAADAEGGSHLLSCSHQPPSVERAVKAALRAISDEAGLSIVRRQAELVRAFYSVAWRHQSAATVMTVLDTMSHIVNTYRRSIPVDSEGNHPITPLRTLRLA